MDTDKLIDKILEISKLKEGKNLLELALKCSEETGELAQAVLSYTEAPGCKHKNLTKEDIIQELADIFLVDLAMVAKLGIDREEFKKEIERKLEKWVKVIELNNVNKYEN